MNLCKLHEDLTYLKNLRFIQKSSIPYQSGIIEVESVTHLKDINSILSEIYENVVNYFNYINHNNNLGYFFVKLNDNYFKLKLISTIGNFSSSYTSNINYIPENCYDIEFLPYTSIGNLISTTPLKSNNSFVNELPTLTLGKSTYYISKATANTTYIKYFFIDYFLKVNNGMCFKEVGYFKNYITINDIVLPGYQKILKMSPYEIKLINNQTLETIIIRIKPNSKCSNNKKLA